MIVITTPTGQIGRQVLGNVLNSGKPIRVIVRDPSRLPSEARKRIDVVQGSHGDSDTVQKAFAGADTVFWLVPPDPKAESVEAAYVGFSRPACVAFKSQGVKRVVGISALGRGTPWAANAGFVTASLKMDDLIAGTGVNYRAVINPSFMDNLLRQVQAIKSQGAFFLPISGDLKQPSACTRDIAATAAKLLLDDSWCGVASNPCSALRTSPTTIWHGSCLKCSVSQYVSSRSRTQLSRPECCKTECQRRWPKAPSTCGAPIIKDSILPNPGLRIPARLQPFASGVRSFSNHAYWRTPHRNKGSPHPQNKSAVSGRRGMPLSV